MTQAITDILLEDGRSVRATIWSDPHRHDLWFVDARALAAPGDLPEVGPFGSETGGRVYLLSRIEEELGRIAEIKRSSC